MDRTRVDTGVEARLARVASFDASCRDRAAIVAAAQDVAHLRRWLEARNAAVAGALAAVSSYPEQALAEAVRVPVREAERIVERSALVAAVPALADALEAGAVDAGHVDVLNRSLRSLEPEQRQALLADADRLVLVAQTVDADEFAGAVRAAADRVRADDGTALLERQRRAARVRTWVDHRTGMWRLSGTFDPLTGVTLAARLKAAKEELFRDGPPSTCPSDPIERDHHLQAHALVALLAPQPGAAAGHALGRPELVAVVDATRPPEGDRPSVDWGLPVELPPAVLALLAPQADVHGIVLWNGLVLHAPGTLDLGRATRLANRAQRRALRALYATCAVPGCAVRFDDCHVHHVVWWRHGGRTDLANLLPVCTRHHTRIHDDGWRVTLGADRSLTVHLPDGRVLATGPPGRRERAA